MRFRRFPGTFALAVTLSLALPAAAQDSGRAATVNGKGISKSRVDMIAKQQAARGAPDNDQLRKSIVDQLVNFELVAQDAEKKGVLRKPELQTQIEVTRMQIIFGAYMNDYFHSHPIKDEAVLAEWNRLKAARGDTEYKARHILVEKESEAKAIIEQIKKGTKFEDLARQSKDPGSKDRGGDLDWNPPGTYVRPFAAALVKLEKGKVTETPVKTDFGFHVIRLDDVRPVQFPAFEQVKPRIVQALQEQQAEKIVRDLRAKAKIE